MDSRVPMARILDVVAYLGGVRVKREDLYTRLGPREIATKDGERADG